MTPLSVISLVPVFVQRSGYFPPVCSSFMRNDQVSGNFGGSPPKVSAPLLLTNDGTLPLKAGRSLAVVGPHATTRAGLLADYAGDSWCYTEK